jgi:class 3 adenylate cyclase
MRMLQSATELDPNLKAAANTPLVAGIALHTGPMVIGLVGAEQHIKPGAVGDAVNVAARLQSLSETCGFPVLLSRATLEMATRDAKPDEIMATFCGQFPVKGRHGLVDVFGIATNSSSQTQETANFGHPVE